MGNTVETMNLSNYPLKLQYSQYHLVTVAIVADKPVISIINCENKEVIGKVQLGMSDPKTLKSTSFYVLTEYFKVLDQKNP